MIIGKRDPEFKFNLGDHAEDEITGFHGIIVCRSQWLHNCNQYAVRSRGLDSDGEPIANQWFDEPQLQTVKTNAVKLSRLTGGPQHEVVRTNRR